MYLMNTHRNTHMHTCVASKIMTYFIFIMVGFDLFRGVEITDITEWVNGNHSGSSIGVVFTGGEPFIKTGKYYTQTHTHQPSGILYHYKIISLVQA